jgi:hypothetical protein
VKTEFLINDIVVQAGLNLRKDFIGWQVERDAKAGATISRYQERKNPSNVPI